MAEAPLQTLSQSGLTHAYSLVHLQVSTEMHAACVHWADHMPAAGAAQARQPISFERTHLVDCVAQPPELIHAGPCLDVGVVPRPDGPHAGRLVPCVALRAVLKVRVWAPRAVHADVACGGNVRTPATTGTLMLGWCRQQSALQMGPWCCFRTSAQRLRTVQHTCRDGLFWPKGLCGAEAL